MFGSFLLFVFVRGYGWGFLVFTYKKFSPLFILLKFWDIHYNKTNYSLKVRKMAKKSDYSLCIIFFSSIH